MLKTQLEDSVTVSANVDTAHAGDTITISWTGLIVTPSDIPFVGLGFTSNPKYPYGFPSPQLKRIPSQFSGEVLFTIDPLTTKGNYFVFIRDNGVHTVAVFPFVID